LTATWQNAAVISVNPSLGVWAALLESLEIQWDYFGPDLGRKWLKSLDSRASLGSVNEIKKLVDSAATDHGDVQEDRARRCQRPQEWILKNGNRDRFTGVTTDFDR
jgi:hypothetical protein